MVTVKIEISESVLDKGYTPENRLKLIKVEGFNVLKEEVKFLIVKKLMGDDVYVSGL